VSVYVGHTGEPCNTVCLPAASISPELQSNFHQIFGRPVAALRYFMYFRFYGWRHVCTVVMVRMATNSLIGYVKKQYTHNDSTDGGTDLKHTAYTQTGLEGGGATQDRKSDIYECLTVYVLRLTGIKSVLNKQPRKTDGVHWNCGWIRLQASLPISNRRR